MAHPTQKSFPLWPLAIGIGGINVALFVALLVCGAIVAAGRMGHNNNAQPLSWWENIMFAYLAIILAPGEVISSLLGREPGSTSVVVAFLNSFLLGIPGAYLIKCIWNYLHKRQDSA